MISSPVVLTAFGQTWMLSCPKCGILKQGVPEDIDKYVDEILDKM